MDSSCTVKRMIRTWGIDFFKILAVSPPFMPGMEKSRSIRSGASSLAFSIASAPFAASPQTVNCSVSTRLRSRNRIEGCSSVIRTLFLDIPGRGAIAGSLEDTLAYLWGNTGIMAENFSTLPASLSTDAIAARTCHARAILGRWKLASRARRHRKTQRKNCRGRSCSASSAQTSAHP
jgi:hypothetical protein